jgi:hypothetical protein
LAIDDLLGLGLPAAPAPAPAPSPPSLKLNAGAVLDPGTFQQKWRQLPICLSEVCFMFMKMLEFIFLSPAPSISQDLWGKSCGIETYG